MRELINMCSCNNYLQWQLNLHWSDLYVEGVDQTILFCTLSPSKWNDSSIILTYIAPMFEYMHVSHPDLDTMHFLSDDPTLQYRQNVNFSLFCTKVFDMGYHVGSWIFWEASNGKGGPDGIGGATKWQIDRLFSLSHDIPDAAQLYSTTIRWYKKKTSTKLFYVEADEPEEGAVPENLPAVPGTTKIQQVIRLVRGTSKYRDVSCFLQLSWSAHARIYFSYLRAASCTSQTYHTSITNKSFKACRSFTVVTASRLSAGGTT